MPLKLDIVTQERRVYSAGDVQMVIAPGIEGELGILPHHAPLITALQSGTMRVKRPGGEDVLAILGGFMEVLPDRVTVLADAAERAEEIDIARAEQARRRAEELMREHPGDKIALANAEMALRRSIIRIKVGQARRQRSPSAPRPS